MSDVVLTFMPYGTVDRPPIGVGYLSANLKKRGISSGIINGHLHFADHIGLGIYNRINNSENTYLIGEWTFSRAAFPDFHVDDEAYFELLHQPADKEALYQVREAAQGYIDTLAARILDGKPRLIGCSSMFQQNCASLALMRRIREWAPEVITVMGGANCESEVGRAIHTHFPWVDYVFSGESDELFPDFCRWILHGIPPEQSGKEPWPPTAILTPETRSLGKNRPVGLAVTYTMNDLPLPEFDDYFAALQDSPHQNQINPALILETSRGCWWGEKSRCTFCGLSAGTIGFRSKSGDKAYQEIDTMANQFNMYRFELVDNIMDMAYFDTLLPRLAKDPRPFRFFYEIKTNLTHKQVECLADAGVLWIQPGIEGLNDRLLKLMKKGNNACHGIRLLKWSRQYGIYVMWNYLCDAPGEIDDWHTEELTYIPLLAHLQAPWNAGTRIRYDRFAAYTVEAEDYKLELEPCPAYRYIYPLDEEQLRDQAYYFFNKNQSLINDGKPQPVMENLKSLMATWRELYYAHSEKGLSDQPAATAPELRMTRPDPDTIHLMDTRPCAVAAEHTLSGIHRLVYDICDAGEVLHAVVSKLQQAGYPDMDNAQAQALLDERIASKTLMKVSGRYLSLGLNNRT